MVKKKKKGRTLWGKEGKEKRVVRRVERGSPYLVPRGKGEN